MYNVKLVKTIFHRCKIYPSFLNESSEKTHEMACFLYVRLPPVLNCELIALHEIFTTPLPPQIISNFGPHSVDTQACYIPHPILLPMFWSQAFKCYDETKKAVTCETLLHRPFLLYSNAEQGQYVQLASFGRSACNHYITLIVSY